MIIGTQRDCSAQLEAALACWAEGSTQIAIDFYKQIPDALSNHRGRGTAASWLVGANIFEPLRKVMAAASVQGLAKVMTSSSTPSLSWLAEPDACGYIAVHEPDFLAELVKTGPSDDLLFFDDGRNFEITLDYFPASIRHDAEKLIRSHFDRDGNDWAQYLANAANALKKHNPSFLPDSIDDAVGWLEENEARSDHVNAFKKAARVK